MKNSEKVLYFILIFIITVFIFIFIIFLLSADKNANPSIIKSNFTDLYINLRSTNIQQQCIFLSADGNIDDFYTHWFIESDPDGTGAVTIRNSRTGKWIYHTIDNLFTINLNARQGSIIDPNGWFYILSGTDKGAILFQSLQDEDLYLTVSEGLQFPFLQLTTLPDDKTRSEFTLIG